MNVNQSTKRFWCLFLAILVVLGVFLSMLQPKKAKAEEKTTTKENLQAFRGPEKGPEPIVIYYSLTQDKEGQDGHIKNVGVTTVYIPEWNQLDDGWKEDGKVRTKKDRIEDLKCPIDLILDLWEASFMVRFIRDVFTALRLLVISKRGKKSSCSGTHKACKRKCCHDRRERF